MSAAICSMLRVLSLAIKLSQPSKLRPISLPLPSSCQSSSHAVQAFLCMNVPLSHLLLRLHPLFPLGYQNTFLTFQSFIFRVMLRSQSYSCCPAMPDKTPTRDGEFRPSNMMNSRLSALFILGESALAKVRAHHENDPAELLILVCSNDTQLLIHGGPQSQLGVMRSPSLLHSLRRSLRPSAGRNVFLFLQPFAQRF